MQVGDLLVLMFFANWARFGMGRIPLGGRHRKEQADR